MSCEVVCAATDVGDAAELIGPTGAVAPPRDPEALAAAWQGLAELGAEGRRTRGKEARERIVRLYDIDAVTKRYEALFNSFQRPLSQPSRRRRGAHVFRRSSN